MIRGAFTLPVQARLAGRSRLETSEKPKDVTSFAGVQKLEVTADGGSGPRFREGRGHVAKVTRRGIRPVGLEEPDLRLARRAGKGRDPKGVFMFKYTFTSRFH